MLHQSFAQLIADGWPRSVNDAAQQPVIFIDDLDRCDPTEVVAFIEQLRQIVVRSDALRCRFVLAVDHEVLIRAISSKFASIGSYDGNRYLEKVFPFAFALPAPNEEQVCELLEKLWRRLGSGADARLEEYWREALTNALSDGSFTNPRLMKRCINRFMLVQHFESTCERKATPEHLALAKWLAATERWPTLRRVIMHSREQLAALTARFLGQTTTTLGTDLDGLISEPGVAAWWARELLVEGEARLHARVEAFQHAERCLRHWGL